MILIVLLWICAAACIIPSVRTLVWFYRNSGAIPVIPVLLIPCGVILAVIALLLGLVT